MSQESSLGRQILNKVPEITIYFWIIKVLCTTVGETASDFLNVNLNLGLQGTSVVMGILLLVALFFQFKTRRYTPILYWLNVVLISIFGTLVTDNLTDGIGVPLEVSTIVFSILLAITFAVWYSQEKTLSMHSIFTRQREAFYWFAVLFTFALGTAAGDLMAESLGLGYATTGLIVCAVIAIFAIAWKSGLNSILSFWLIYIMTRPLGASLGDYLSQSREHGGLGLGATVTTGVFIAGILVTVIYLAFTKRDVASEDVLKKEEAEGGNIFAQVAVVSLCLILASVGGYYWRQHVLKSEAQASAVAPSGSSALPSPLGDLSSFKVIAQDMLDKVNAGDLSGAKKRADDLEYEWDNAEARLKPMNAAKWTEIDGTIDKVLREARAVSPSEQSEKAALEALLASLNGA